MRSKLTILALACLTIFSCKKVENTPPGSAASTGDRQTETSNSAAKPANTRTAWVNCELYEGVWTTIPYGATHGKFDKMYVIPYGFLDGYGVICATMPTDTDYHGGRWEEQVLMTGVDPFKYWFACSEADLDPNDFVPSGNYYEIPHMGKQ